MDRTGKDDRKHAYDETVTPVTPDDRPRAAGDVAQEPTLAPDAPGLAATGIDVTGDTVSPVPGDLRGAADRGSAGEPGPGAKLDHFTVLDRLGSGGMGVVLAAYDPDLDRKVAIKLLRPDLFGAGSEAARARLLREAQAMAKLTHPNVITVHEVGMVDGRVFVAMEYVDGGTLRVTDGTPPRPWRATLDLYLQAGRGLAAAHRAGLVHRDFKPDNVLVGKDGRVRVTDFGLVGMIDDVRGTAPHEPREAAVADAAPRRLSQSELTRTGSIMGTPAYMAPEQHAGQAVDARADQFAYCVALHEALYGVRPFAGDTYQQLVANVLAGRMVAPPSAIELPSWLRAVILRGLAVEPAARYPDMDAVLAELAYDRRHARRRTAIVAAGFAVVLGVAGVAVLRGGDDERCTGARGQLAGVWDDALRGRVATAFAADPATAVLGPPVARTIDGYADGWAAMWTDACKATHVRGEQTGATLDLRMRCLHRRRDELGELVGLWTGPTDRTMLDHALEAASLLPAVATCADLDALAATVPLPADPAARQRIEALQRELAAVTALDKSGAYPAAVPKAQALAAATAAASYAPLRAEALIQLAHLLRKTGDSEAAIPMFRDAATEAGRAADDDLVAEAWIGLATLHLDRASYDLAEELLVLAAAAVARTGDDIYLVRELANLRGTLRLRQGRHAEARTALEEAVALHTRSLGPDHPLTMRTIGNAAVLYMEMGDVERGRALLTDVLAAEEKVYGPRHPELIRTLNNLAKTYDRGFQPAEARPLLERALAIASTTLGPDHPDVGVFHDNLGITLARLGDLDGARAHHERAIAIGEQRHAPDHPDLARARHNLASLEKGVGNYARARELLEQALAANQKVLGPEHPTVAGQLGALAAVLGSLGEHALAREHYQRALALQERILGAEHPELAATLNDFGTALEAEGRLDEAAAHYARALAIWDKALGSDSPQLSIVLTNLGSIANRQGRHRDAIGHCERVRALDVAALGADHPDVAYSLTCLGVAMRGAGRAKDAIDLLEQGLALRAGKAAPDAEAESRFELARALWSVPREHARARALGEAARGLYDQAGPGFVERKGEVEAWLRGHRAP